MSIVGKAKKSETLVVGKEQTLRNLQDEEQQLGRLLKRI